MPTSRRHDAIEAFRLHSSPIPAFPSELSAWFINLSLGLTFLNPIPRQKPSHSCTCCMICRRIEANDILIQPRLLHWTLHIVRRLINFRTSFIFPSRGEHPFLATPCQFASRRSSFSLHHRALGIRETASRVMILTSLFALTCSLPLTLKPARRYYCHGLRS